MTQTVDQLSSDQFQIMLDLYDVLFRYVALGAVSQTGYLIIPEKQRSELNPAVKRYLDMIECILVQSRAQTAGLSDDADGE